MNKLKVFGLGRFFKDNLQVGKFPSLTVDEQRGFVVEVGSAVALDVADVVEDEADPVELPGVGLMNQFRP
jgi:hypothetical protein